MMSDTLNSPQGDGNTFPVLAYKLANLVRHPQFPARGRKPSKVIAPVCYSPFRQTPSIPRKGTETHLVRYSKPVFQLSCQTPSIPRKGTETLMQSFMKITHKVVRHPQFPARGRKPSQSIGTKKGPKPRQTPSIPRKGTETCRHRWVHHPPQTVVRHPQFPARGRKRRLWSKSPAPQPIPVRHPQFPARGRKQTQSSTNGLRRHVGQTPSIPRKGTETLLPC